MQIESAFCGCLRNSLAATGCYRMASVATRSKSMDMTSTVGPTTSCLIWGSKKLDEVLIYRPFTIEHSTSNN